MLETRSNARNDTSHVGFERRLHMWEGPACVFASSREITGTGRFEKNMFYLIFLFLHFFFLITFIPITRNVNLPCMRNHCDRSSLWRDVGSIRPTSLLQAYRHEIGEKKFTDHMPKAANAALLTCGYRA